MRQNPVLYSDLMATLVEKLSAQIALVRPDVFVGVATPELPVERVVLRRDGGRELTQVTQATWISITVYAADYGDVEDLTRLVELEFYELIDGDPVVNAVLLSASQDISDLRGPRRFLRFEVHHRGTSL